MKLTILENNKYLLETNDGTGSGDIEYDGSKWRYGAQVSGEIDPNAAWSFGGVRIGGSAETLGDAMEAIAHLFKVQGKGG